LKTEPITQIFFPNHSRKPFPGRSLPLALLLTVVAVYCSLRLVHIGHPLAWDEAWILNAVKSLAEGGDASFQNQLWRHPPIYLGLGLLLAPLKPDFAQRMEMLSLILHTCAFLVFAIFTAQILGRRIALYASAAYAMLPGPIFYSTWIKRDSLVIFFCMLALWAFFKKRDLLAGVLLSLGFLSKESAVFYAISMLIMIPLLRPRESLGKTFIKILVPVFVISGWWYLFYGSGTQGHLLFFRGDSAETPLFANAWWYYFAKLKHDLGIPGLLIFAAGLISLLHPKLWYKKTILGTYLKKPRLLPIYILFPAYLILAISHGKPPWINIVLFPFLALVIGMGWQFLLKTAADLCHGLLGRRITLHPALTVLLLISVLSLSLLHFSYMGYLATMSPGTANVIHRSYRIAAAVNEAARANDKVLVMPMIIQPELKTQPDPIIFWQLKPTLRIYRVPQLGLDFDRVKIIIETERINRLLIFPVEGSNQEKIVQRIIKDINPEGLSIPGKTLVINVDGYWKESALNAVPQAEQF